MTKQGVGQAKRAPLLVYIITILEVCLCIITAYFGTFVVQEAQHNLQSYDQEYERLQKEDEKLRKDDQILRHEKVH